MHYLAAMMKAAGVQVSVHTPCFYNPLIPVKPLPDDDDVILYPEAHLGRRLGGKRFCWYFLYYASSYHKERVPPNEAVIVWHRDYFDDVQSWTDHLLTDDDVIIFPILDATWCFPEPKTRSSIWFQGKGLAARPDTILDSISIVSHCNTLALLRETEKFYTSDLHTLMSCEAALCGCKVFHVKPDGSIHEQSDILKLAESQIMKPSIDMQIALRFAERVGKFFGEKL